MTGAKVLLDECTPRVVKRRLPGWDVRTVQETGWAGVKNGELLRRGEALFDVLISSDQNLRHQQNLSGRRLAFIILPSNQVPVVTLLIAAVEQALQTIRQGDVVEIPLPP